MSDQSTRALALVQQVADELAIRRTLSRLAQAQDDRDRDKYKTCFTDKIMLTEAAVIPDWTPQEVSVDQLAELYFAEIDKLDFGHHLVVNHVITIDGDQATCDADLFAVAAQSEGEDRKTSMAGGRYALKLKRVGDEWRIYERAVRMRYRL